MANFMLSDIVAQLKRYQDENAIGDIKAKGNRNLQFEELYIQNYKHEFFKTYHCVEANIIRLFCKDENTKEFKTTPIPTTVDGAVFEQYCNNQQNPRADEHINFDQYNVYTAKDPNYVMRQNYVKLARQAYWESLDKENVDNEIDWNYYSRKSS